MDNLLTLVLEIILDGAVSAAAGKKVPMIIRIVLAVFLIALWLGLCILLFRTGVGTGRYSLVVLSAVIFAGYIVIVAGKIKNMKG